jgi:hypothetical protein
MVVQNNSGGIGHVSVILNTAEESNGDRIYLIGYSYMPAQEFHIEDAKNTSKTDSWFTKKGYIQYLQNCELGKLGRPVFRRF